MFDHFARKLVGGRGTGPVVTGGGYHWHLSPAAVALFPAGPDPDGWHRAGAAVVVKQNLQRTISRAAILAGNDAIKLCHVFVKVCRANTPRAVAREWLRPAKARLEYENLAELRRRGVGSVEPLAWGSRSRHWPGDSVLITREQPGVRPLHEVLAETTAPAERRALAGRFGAYLARLHAAGVRHPDPHPGNVLVTPAGEFLLMDVHAVRFAPGPLAWPAARDDLVLWNRWFQPRATTADRGRFWRAYTAAGRASPVRQRAEEVEELTRRSNRRFWTARLARYTSDNRDTQRIGRGRLAGFAVRDWLPADLEQWLTDPDAAFAAHGVVLWKDSASATVAPVVVRLTRGDVPAVAKRFKVKSAGRAAKNAVRPSPARRSWVLGHNLLDRGLPTPRPLLLLERHRFGLPHTGTVVFERVADSLELPGALAAVADRPDRRRVVRAWAEALGRLLRAMHDAEVAHRDLKAANVLMQGAAVDPAAAVPVLIDLVGVTVGRPVPDAVRVRDLARLAASFLASPAVTNGDRLTLLRAYLGPRGPAWKHWWLWVAGAVRAKAAKNARSGRPLA